MKESAQLELNEKVTDSFLKTVSAFANGEGGLILFGVNDAGVMTGLKDVQASAIQIENKINDSVQPVPDYRLEVDEQAGTVAVYVSRGRFAPYYLGSKAWQRMGTSTVEMDRFTLESMILKRQNLPFESLQARTQELIFTTLDGLLRRNLSLENPGPDVYRSLGLLKPDTGFTVAAELLSDQNAFPGIDLVLFGRDEDEIRYRSRIQGQSVLEQYLKAEEIFSLFFRSELIRGAEREEFYRIPLKAFREALINAIVHRDWHRDTTWIQVRMYEDHLDIHSPGGLPQGLSPRNYLEDMVSVLRNPTLAMTFLRIGYIEQFGTGVRRILSQYAASPRQPEFLIRDSSVTVRLPVADLAFSLTTDQEKVVSCLEEHPSISRRELENHVGFGRTKLSAILSDLRAKQRIVQLSGGRSARYRVASPMDLHSFEDKYSRQLEEAEEGKNRSRHKEEK